jgi:hypothetical protein
MSGAPGRGRFSRDRGGNALARITPGPLGASRTLAPRRHCSPRYRNGVIPRGSRDTRTLRPTGPDVRSSGALIPALHFKLNCLAFLQVVKIQLLKTAAMKEYLLSVRGPDKSKSAVADNSLNCALHRHLDCVWNLRGGSINISVIPSLIPHALCGHFTSTQVLCQRKRSARLQNIMSCSNSPAQGCS